MQYAITMIATPDTYEYNIVEYENNIITRTASVTITDINNISPVKNNVSALIYAQEHAKEILDIYAK